VEPRASGPAGPTQRDLGVEAPRSLVEAKLNPTRLAATCTPVVADVGKAGVAT
jgi:hypothetical protein